MFARIVFIVIVSMILMTPLVGLVCNFTVGKSVAAGTKNFPEFSHTINKEESRLNYLIDFESWFNANHAAEGLFLRIGNEIKFLLGQTKELIVGRDGWLADRKTQEYLTNIDTMPDTEIQGTVEMLKRFQHYLAQRDIFFMIVVIPLKTTVYPERFPQLPARPYTGYERFQKAFKSNAIPTVDTLVQTMRNAPHPTHYKTDVHFNSYGAYLTSQKILEFLYNQYDLKKPKQDVKIRMATGIKTSANNAMPKIFPYVEYNYPAISVPKNFKSYRRIIKSGQKDIESYSVKAGGFSLLPKSMMFGNSFMLTYESDGFYNHFSEHSRVLDYEFFTNVLDYIEEDLSVFILQIYESQLWFHLNEKHGVPYWDARINALPLPAGYKFVPYN